MRKIVWVVAGGGAGREAERRYEPKIMPSSSNKTKSKRGKKKGGTTASGGAVPLLLTSLSALDDDDDDFDGNGEEAAGESDAIITTPLSTLTIDDGRLGVKDDVGDIPHGTTASGDGGGGNEDGDDDEEEEKSMDGQQILLALIRLADALAQLTPLDKGSNGSTSGDEIESMSHWRTLPTLVKSAYQMLDDACLLLSNTATKYVLVAKAAAKTTPQKTTSSSSSSSSSNNNKIDDTAAVYELASELLKGSEMIGAATYILYSDVDCGSSDALRKYIKLYSRGVVLSVVSLVQYFEESLHTTATATITTTTTTTTTISAATKFDDKDAAAQKAGAVWDACDKINAVLPRGNRNAIRRDVLNWVKDCNITIEEFDILLLQSVNKNDCTANNNSSNENDNGDDGMYDNNDDDDEVMYTAPEMKIVHASMNVIKCSKNVLNLILATCEYIGANCVDALLPNTASDDGKYTASTQRNMALRWITNLHILANTIGEGVTDLGVLLYPPLDFESTMNYYSDDDNDDRKTTTSDNDNVHDNGDLVVAGRLGQTAIGSKLEYQLRSIINVVTSIGNIEFLSDEVAQEALRLKGAVQIRLRECEEAIVIVER